MTEHGQDLCSDRQGRGPTLHPLEIVGSPRRRYLVALGAQLLSTGGLLAAVVFLLVLPQAGGWLVTVAAAVAVAGRLCARHCVRRAWAGLARPGRAVGLPVTEDRRFTAAVAVLFSAVAVAASTAPPTGAYLAVMIGLDAVIGAADSFRLLAGRAPQPARRAPALLTATAVCWTAAVVVGGLSVQTVLSVSATSGVLAALCYGLVHLGRRAWPRSR